jgi:hypothetical protein
MTISELKLNIKEMVAVRRHKSLQALGCDASGLAHKRSAQSSDLFC